MTDQTTMTQRHTHATRPILEVEDLVKHFPVKGGFPRREVERVQAVDRVSFQLRAGETLGLVGESGCGKSTTGRLLVGLLRATAGTIRLDGDDVTPMGKDELSRIRRDVQFVFQDPHASLNPRRRVASILTDPLRQAGVPKEDRASRIRELLEMVGLNHGHAARYPQEFSGGQRQRIGIARALAMNPRVLILDEPVSALDVSIQAQVVGLLQDLQEELGLAYLFVAHDLSVIRHVCDRVAVMYLGRIVETGTRDQIYADPSHPYTRSLLSAVPRIRVEDDGPGRLLLEGDLPSPSDPPSGCRFRTRCWKAADRCAAEDPALDAAGPNHHPCACFYPVATDEPIPLTRRQRASPLPSGGPADVARTQDRG